jgi:hypothetical protein
VPNQTSVEAAIGAALDMLLADDLHLLEADTSERSLSHQLAVRLAAHFPGFHVDCEYNRDGFDVKKLALPERHATDDSLEAVTVFPDIIIHVRGRTDQNLLVIEMKKASSRVGDEYDLKKLDAFKSDLGYQFALHLKFGLDPKGELVRKLQWR